MSNKLSNYLRGQVSLLEYMTDQSLGATGMSGVGSQLTARDCGLRDAYRDLMLKFEAVWLDIRELCEECYVEAEQPLDDVRALGAANVREALRPFEALTQILSKYTEDEKYEADKMRIMLSRWESLCEELNYLVKEFDPDTPKPPGLSYKTRKEYDSKGSTPAESVKIQSTSTLYSSVAVASLARCSRMLSENDKLGEAIVIAGDAIRAIIEEYTDADYVTVDVGNAVPGSLPRFDVYCEWATNEVSTASSAPSTSARAAPRASSSGASAGSSTSSSKAAAVTHPAVSSASATSAKTDSSSATISKPVATTREPLKTTAEAVSDCYGYLRLRVDEDEVRMYDLNDKCLGGIHYHAKITDEDLAESFYANLSPLWDASSRRHTPFGSRVVPALTKLAERAARGTTIPDYAVPQILAGLRAGIGIHKAVHLPANSIALRISEVIGSNIHYHFSWAVKAPTAKDTNFSDELNPWSGDMNDPVPQDVDRSQRGSDLADDQKRMSDQNEAGDKDYQRKRDAGTEWARDTKHAVKQKQADLEDKGLSTHAARARASREVKKDNEDAISVGGGPHLESKDVKDIELLKKSPAGSSRSFGKMSPVGRKDPELSTGKASTRAECPSCADQYDTAKHKYCPSCGEKPPHRVKSESVLHYRTPSIIFNSHDGTVIMQGQHAKKVLEAATTDRQLVEWLIAMAWTDYDGEEGPIHEGVQINRKTVCEIVECLIGYRSRPMLEASHYALSSLVKKGVASFKRRYKQHKGQPMPVDKGASEPKGQPISLRQSKSAPNVMYVQAGEQRRGVLVKSDKKGYGVGQSKQGPFEFHGHKTAMDAAKHLIDTKKDKNDAKKEGK